MVLHEFDPDGNDALVSARISSPGALERIKFLVEECKMDINRPKLWFDGQSGDPNFFMEAVATQKQFDEDFEILDYLISQGADVNAEVFHCYPGIGKKIMYTVLSYAVKVSKAPRYVIDWLIQHGAK